MSSRRVLKAAEAIREVVSMAILTDLRDPRIEDVTVTYVEVSPDMRQAKVHVSIMGDDAKQRLCLHGLRSSAGYLQSKIADRIASAYEAKQQAQTDAEKIAADERIKTLEARRDVLVGEGGSRINAIMRAGFGVPPMVYLGKLYLWDKVLGLGATDPLSPELWNVLWTVVSFYFLDQIAGRVTRRK